MYDSGGTPDKSTGSTGAGNNFDGDSSDW